MDDVVKFRVVYDAPEDAEAVAAEVRDHGGEAELKQEPGLLPLAVMLVVAIPPGLALLAKVISRIVQEWRGHGTLIDARGTGAPKIVKEADLPYGTVVVLTRDGDEAQRTELPEEKLGDYIASVLQQIAGGVPATAADAAAATALRSP